MGFQHRKRVSQRASSKKKKTRPSTSGPGRSKRTRRTTHTGSSRNGSIFSRTKVDRIQFWTVQVRKKLPLVRIIHKHRVGRRMMIGKIVFCHFCDREVINPTSDKWVESVENQILWIQWREGHWSILWVLLSPPRLARKRMNLVPL